MSSIFHLFPEESQLLLAKIVSSLLSPEKGSVIFGQHVGMRVKGLKDEVMYNGPNMFCHSPESWGRRCLWWRRQGWQWQGEGGNRADKCKSGRLFEERCLALEVVCDKVLICWLGYVWVYVWTEYFNWTLHWLRSWKSWTLTLKLTNKQWRSWKFPLPLGRGISDFTFRVFCGRFDVAVFTTINGTIFPRFSRAFDSMSTPTSCLIIVATYLNTNTPCSCSKISETPTITSSHPGKCKTNSGRELLLSWIRLWSVGISLQEECRRHATYA